VRWIDDHPHQRRIDPKVWMHPPVASRGCGVWQ
jgi:hypothetical protein